VPDAGREALQLNRQALRLRPQLARDQARLAHPLEPGLQIRQLSPEVRHALADRLHALALEFERFHGLLHLAPNRGQILPGRLGLLIGLPLKLGDFAGPIDDGLVQLLERSHLLLHRVQSPLVLLDLPHAGVDLAHGAIQLVRSGDRAVDRVTLGFEPGRLLRHGVAQRLERADLPSDVLDRLLNAIHPAHRLLDAGDPALLVLQVAAQILATPVQSFHLGQGKLVPVEQAIMLLTQSGHLLARAFDLGPDSIRVAAQELEGPIDLEERLDPILEVEGEVQLAANLLVGRGDLLGVPDDLGDPRLGPPLILRQHLGALGDGLVLVRQLRQRGKPLLQLRQA